MSTPPSSFGRCDGTKRSRRIESRGENWKGGVGESRVGVATSEGRSGTVQGQRADLTQVAATLARAPAAPLEAAQRGCVCGGEEGKKKGSCGSRTGLTHGARLADGAEARETSCRQHGYEVLETEHGMYSAASATRDKSVAGGDLAMLSFARAAGEARLFARSGSNALSRVPSASHRQHPALFRASKPVSCNML